MLNGTKRDYQDYTNDFSTATFARDGQLLPHSFPKPNNAEEI